MFASYAHPVVDFVPHSRPVQYLVRIGRTEHTHISGFLLLHPMLLPYGERGASSSGSSGESEAEWMDWLSDHDRVGLRGAHVRGSKKRNGDRTTTWVKVRDLQEQGKSPTESFSFCDVMQGEGG